MWPALVGWLGWPGLLCSLDRIVWANLLGWLGRIVRPGLLAGVRLDCDACYGCLVGLSCGTWFAWLFGKDCVPWFAW